MITHRPAADSDKPFLKQLARCVYEEVVVEQFGDWETTSFDQHFEDLWPEQGYEIIEADGDPIGAVWLAVEPDHFWLREIQIVPKHQGKGIGEKLLQDIIEQARTANMPLRLRVLKANRARSLYERLGFAVTGTYKDSHVWMELSAE